MKLKRYCLNTPDGTSIGSVFADRIKTEGGTNWTVTYFFVGYQLVLSIWDNRILFDLSPEDRELAEQSNDVPEQHDADRVRFPL